MEEGMTDGVQWQDTLETIDPTLTMFALAHGMDLSRGDGYRRLKWFSDGLERGILIRPADEGTLAVDVMAWRNGALDTLTGGSATDPTSVDEIAEVLKGAIDVANTLEASD
jgi:hypothetical protein